MKDIRDIKDISLDELVDIQDVKVDINLSREEKIIDYINQIKNPYMYRYKNFKIKVSFDDSQNAKTLEECLENYIENLI